MDLAGPSRPSARIRAEELNGKVLKQGDGAATDERKLVVTATAESEIMLFDLA